MLNNKKVRNVIDTITSKVVLILGRFTDERKAVLDALREELRKRNYLPILFDFDKPTNQTTDETITLLARMSRFVIADISDAKSVAGVACDCARPSLSTRSAGHHRDAGGAGYVRLLLQLSILPESPPLQQPAAIDRRPR
jgi:hypothetical protein